MAGSSGERIYFLDIIVKAVSYTDTDAENGPAAILMRFLDFSEQTLAEEIAAPICPGEPVPVHEGKTFTFATKAESVAANLNRPLTIRLIRLLGEDTLPSVEEAGTGVVDAPELMPVLQGLEGGPVQVELDVNVLLNDGKTVAVMSVMVRLLGTGAVFAKSLKITRNDQSKVQQACASGPEESVGRTATTIESCKKKKNNKSCKRSCQAGCEASTAVQHTKPVDQYTTISCELNGQKIDLRVRKKNPETCRVERRAMMKAEDFNRKVLEMAKKMHTLTSNILERKMQQENKLAELEAIAALEHIQQKPQNS